MERSRPMSEVLEECAAAGVPEQRAIAVVVRRSFSGADPVGAGP